jgi:predicted regulator of Ras-like GTPase activity (Roadblock/LC7/MglB family)
MGVYMLEQFVFDILKINGVTSAILIDYNGPIINQSFNENIDIGTMSIMAYKNICASIDLGYELKWGGCEHMIVEHEKGPIILSPLNQNKVLAVIGQRNVNITRVMQEIKKIKVQMANDAISNESNEQVYI